MPQNLGHAAKGHNPAEEQQQIWRALRGTAMLKAAAIPGEGSSAAQASSEGATPSSARPLPNLDTDRAWA